MKRDIYLNDFGDMLESATIRQWHVQKDDQVTDDDILLSFETAKAIMEAPSPVNGKVTELYASAGNTVDRQTPLAAIEVNE